MLKKIVFCVLAIGCLLPIAAQSSDTIVTVEETYLGSAESIIVRELVRSSGYDAKLIALSYIEEAVGDGGGGSDVFDSLTALAGEGMLTVIREEGRVVNNYPDIRRRACELLGKTGSEQAVPTLISLIYVDNEPSVISAAIKALADIGYNDNDRTVEMINWVARKFNTVLPTTNLAFEILDAYEKLGPSVENKSAMADSIIMIASNYSYPTPVRDRAYEVLRIALGGEE